MFTLGCAKCLGEIMKWMVDAMGQVVLLTCIPRASGGCSTHKGRGGCCGTTRVFTIYLICVRVVKGSGWGGLGFMKGLWAVGG